MLNYFRALFVRHHWLEIDDAQRRCLVCGRQEMRDIQVEILGPNAWIKTARGNAALHFTVFLESDAVPAPVPVHAVEQAKAD